MKLTSPNYIWSFCILLLFTGGCRRSVVGEMPSVQTEVISDKGEYVLSIAAVPRSPYYSPDLEGGGPFMEVSRRAFEIAGYEVDVRWMPWKRCLQEAKEGRVDVLGMAYYNDDSNNYVLYADEPIGRAETAIFMAIDTNWEYSNLETMKDLRGAKQRSLFVSNEFSAIEWSSLTEVAEEAQMVRMLMKGRLDFIAGSKYAIYSAFERSFPDKEASDHLVQVGPVLKQGKMYNAFPRVNMNHKKLQREFSEGFRKLKESGEYEQILRKHNMELSSENLSPDAK